MDYARKQFELAKPIGEKGETKYKQLKSVERQTGKTPAELILPDVDKSVSYVWDLYLRTKKACGNLDVQTINAYLNITRESLSRFELDALLDIEKIRQEVVNG